MGFYEILIFFILLMFMGKMFFLNHKEHRLQNESFGILSAINSAVFLAQVGTYSLVSMRAAAE